MWDAASTAVIADRHERPERPERPEHGRKNLCCCTDGNLKMWAHLSPAIDRGGPVHRVEQGHASQRLAAA